MGVLAVLFLFLTLAGCANSTEESIDSASVEGPDYENKISEDKEMGEELASEEEIFVDWVVGNASFTVPMGCLPQNMLEDKAEYCAYQVGELFIMVSAVPLKGRFSLEDFEKTNADAYLEELKAPDDNGYAPATVEMIMAGDLPYYLLGYAYEEGSWVSFHTLLDGVAYTFTGWRPGEHITEEDVQYLWGTASTLQAIPLEEKGESAE